MQTTSGQIISSTIKEMNQIPCTKQWQKFTCCHYCEWETLERRHRSWQQQQMVKCPGYTVHFPRTIAPEPCV